MHGKQEIDLHEYHPLPLEKNAMSRETEPLTTSNNGMFSQEVSIAMDPFFLGASLTNMMKDFLLV